VSDNEQEYPPCTGSLSFSLGAVGISLGFFNRGGFNPAKPETLPLALLHTFSMELFFRGFLLKTLADSMERFWIPLFIAAILYALYYLTMWSVWTQPFLAQVMFMLRFIFVGVLFGYAYRKSGSLTVNWMMHILTGMQFRLLF
jgi:membrane protease YdiL (CAAX protease family)